MYMTTKKQQSRKNKSRSNRKQKQHKQKQQKQQFFIGGTCAACGACMSQNNVSPSPSMPSLFRGGTNCTRKRRGGGNDNPSFDGTLPQRYYYKLNPHDPDPISPSQLTASRQLPDMYKMKGGKNRTKKGTKRGGSLLGFSWFNGQTGTPISFNPLNTIGDISTSQIGSNYISGNIGQSVLPNPSVLSQPVDSKYNIYNRPLA
uniref:Uncharacterized protein n=1 Tax=viral metagenome TaxID=1070528 RepID=A0A6C0HHI9_9ZZZZ